MVDPTVAPESPFGTTAPANLAGQCVAAHVVVCATCLQRIPIYHERGIKLTKEWAERQVKTFGWALKLKRWYCPACKGGKKV